MCKTTEEIKVSVGILQKEVKQIKSTMATKSDLKKLEKTLIPLRDKASKYDLLISFYKSKMFIPMVIIFVGIIGLAGQRIMELVGLIK